MKFTKKALNNLKKMEGYNDRLTKRIINDLLSTGLSTSELKDHMRDIINYGCSSGCVGSLIYYSDTVRFFNCYKKEILTFIKKFGFNIDNIYKGQKTFSKEEKNYLTWLSYEEIVYIIATEYFEL